MRRLVVVLFTAAVLATGQASSGLDKAWNLAAKGQPDEAIALLRTLIAKDRTNADAHLLLGSLLMEKGEREECLAQLQEAVKLRPRSADAQNALGEAYEAFGDHASAVAPFERAVAVKPGFAVAQANLGEALLETGKMPEAAAHLEKAIALLGRSPDSAQPRYLRAKIYSDRNQPQQAEAQLEAAVAARPDFPEAWSDLGEVKKLLGDDAGALHAFERAVSQRPDDGVAQYRLGLEYLQQNQAASAVEHLQKAFELHPQDQSVLNSLQMALRKDNRPAEADAVKQKLTELLREKDRTTQNALQAVRLNNEGAGLEKGGDLSAALDKYRQAVALAPQHAGIRMNYAVALLRTGQWTEGLNQIHEALHIDPGNTQIQAALKDALKQAPPATIPDWARH